MSFRPDARELLSIARETLLASLIPALPPEKQYDARMIANALGIALRELDQGLEAARAELDELQYLLGPITLDVSTMSEAEVVDRLRNANRELVQRIRAGELDEGPRAEALVEHLEKTLERAVAIDNPKALAGR